MLDHLFVFGTLLSGYDHPMARRLAREAELLGPAHCCGRLYLVRHYPGLVASDDPADRVFGELYRLPSPSKLLPVLDDYEGCGAGAAEPTEFVRRQHSVTLDGDDASQAPTNAWAYLYNRPVEHLPRITSGRFLPH